MNVRERDLIKCLKKYIEFGNILDDLKKKIKGIEGSRIAAENQAIHEMQALGKHNVILQTEDGKVLCYLRCDPQNSYFIFYEEKHILEDVVEQLPETDGWLCESCSYFIPGKFKYCKLDLPHEVLVNQEGEITHCGGYKIK
jgi:hypothetical protein